MTARSTPASSIIGTKLLDQERLGELRDAVGQPRPVRRVGLPQVHLRVDDHRVLSRILRKLCRARRRAAMAVDRVADQSRRSGKCPGEHCAHAGEGGDREKSGAERFADFGMNDGLPRRREAGEERPVLVQ